MKKLFLFMLIIIFLIVIIGVIGCQATPEDLMEAMAIPVETSDFYTPKSYAEYEKALAHAQEVLEKDDPSGFTLYNATQDLKNSIKKLQKKADKSSLAEIISNAKSIDISPYIPKTQSALLDAIELAEKVFEDENAVDDDVQKVKTNIDTAIEGLILIPDKNELSAIYDTALEIEEDKYISQTYEKLEKALSDAKSVIKDENAIEETVKTTLQALLDAIEGLEERPDKTELIQLIATASGCDCDKYTTSSYNSLQNAISSANKTVNDKDANKDSVNLAIIEIQQAIDGLALYSTCVWEITVTLSCEDRNHVGDDWSTTIYYNNEAVSRSFDVTKNEGTSLQISAKVVENDNSPDIGTGSAQITLSDGNEVQQKIYVTENRGKYAGYQATWVLAVKCKLKERI